MTNKLENLDNIFNFLENNVIKIDSRNCLITNKLNQYFQM